MSSVLIIDGQRLPIPDDIAQDDHSIHRALGPMFTQLANGSITRVIAEDKTVEITVTKQAGRKGYQEIIHSLDCQPHHINPAVAFAGSDTKTSEPRALVMGGDLYDVLRTWDATTRVTHPDCQWVCHYLGRGLKSIRTAWQKACVKLGLGKWTKPKGKMIGQRGYVGALIHDFRRTGVKNLSDSGVPEKIAMAISGHKTRSIFDLYNIVSEARLEEAGALVVARHRKLTEGTSDGLAEPGTPLPQ